MKKLFIAMSMFISAGLFAMPVLKDAEVDPKVISAFQKEFSFAKNVKWESGGEISKVRFSLNDQGFAAWYNAEAELLSTARNILYMQLPLSVIRSLEDSYKNADILSILEITKNNETYYEIQAEEKNKKLLLNATPSGSISVIKKEKK